MAKILVVDDEANIRFFLEEMLARDGHAVSVVESGEKALGLIQQQEFDLALVDLKLDDISGTDVLRALRQKSQDTVVIMLTGHGSLETAVEALRQGAHDYLFKPCKTVEIRESIRQGLLKRQQALRQRQVLQQLEQHLAQSLQNVRATIGGQAEADIAAPPPEMPRLADALSAPADTSDEAEARFLKHGPLLVDFMRHVITLDGNLLELSPTEFDLLAYLVSEAPRVISPQELIREVQGYEAEAWDASDTVRYHVYRLRQKIQTASDRSGTDVIKTVRGIGYTVGKAG